MTREEQKEIRELKKLLPIELRKQSKEFGFQFAHGFLYRFEGDFLYYAILDISSNRSLTMTTLIKPWILNELYWEIQQMNMEEMRAQPKSFHMRGAFTINDIFYRNDSVPYDKDNLGQAVHEALVQFNVSIKEHLTNIQAITCDMEGYRISNLTKALALIYSHDYENALHLLLQEDLVNDTYIHVSGKGKTAKDYAVDFCRVILNDK
ncbi:hypothetical protein [Lacrimispora brassicae]